jgi:membrane associated rhomboid family serine protease
MAKRKVNKSVPSEARFRAVCVNCGTLIPVNSGITKDEKNYCSSCAAAMLNAPIVPPAAPAEEKRLQQPFAAPSGILRILSYIVSLSPVFGFLFGTIFYSQKDEALKKFGRNCFIMMGIGIAISLVVFMLIIAAGAAFGGGMGGINFGEGYY